MGMIGIDVPVEKSSIDDRNTGKSRGWLNWLSRGMLGAGGTDDSSQFSGVVSDDVIKVLLFMSYMFGLWCTLLLSFTCIFLCDKYSSFSMTCGHNVSLSLFIEDKVNNFRIY